MNKEFFDAIELIEQEKGIPQSYMLEKIKQALLTAYRRANVNADNIDVECDPEKKTIAMNLKKKVVATSEDIQDPTHEISLDEAMKINARIQVDDIVSLPIDMTKFGRISAQSAKQVIIQGIREAERGMIYREFNSKAQELLTGIVTRVDPNSGVATVEISSGTNTHNDLRLLASEQIPGEDLYEGKRIKVYVVEVQQSSRGPHVMISRTHPGLIRRLFELEVPEIRDGSVEIMGLSREAGSRTKMSVRAVVEGVDPIGACIGPRGSRVGNVLAEISGEHVDIVPYSDDPATYVGAALAPAQVIKVTMDGEKSCQCIVPDDQLSLAIGREGQNARLAARMTGIKIDIKPASYEG